MLTSQGLYRPRREAWDLQKRAAEGVQIRDPGSEEEGGHQALFLGKAARPV